MTHDITPELEAMEFWELTQSDGLCEIWLGKRDRNGDPVHTVQGVEWCAKEYALQNCGNDKPSPHHYLLTTCGEQLCVKPGHLIWTTDKSEHSGTH